MNQGSVLLPEPVRPHSGFHGFKKIFAEGWNKRLLAEFEQRLNGSPVVFRNPYGPVHLANSYAAGWNAVDEVNIDTMMAMNKRATGDTTPGRRIYEETRQRLFGKRSGASHVG